MNRRVNLEKYTQDVFNSGYYVGAMRVALPIQELMTKLEEENFEHSIETLIAIANVIRVVAEPLDSEEIQKEMSKYNDVIKNQDIYVEIEGDN